MLPSPTTIAKVFVGEGGQLILANTWPTAVQTVSGFAAAALLGVLVASAMVYSDVVRETIYPYLIAFQVIPKIALAPLFVLWLGIGFWSRFAFATFMSFFPIVIALIAGLKDTRPEAVRMCEAFGGSKAQIFRYIRFPYAIDYLFAGLKIGATMSIIGVVIGEFITADRGLGYLILWATSRSNTPLVMASIVVLCGLGLGIYGLVVLAERTVNRIYSDG
jgi:NitT/TauT family transport system permease protein